MCNVLFSYACIIIGQVFICRYIIMAVYSFMPLFREATFVMCRHVSLSNQGAMGEKSLQTGLMKRSCGSSGSIVSDYGLDDQGSIPDRGRGFFF
jgi:hypothetical protein